jgi:hypothetical protein
MHIRRDLCSDGKKSCVDLTQNEHTARYLVDISGLNLVANSKASSPGRMARAGSPTTGRSGISFDACSPFTRLTMATDRDPTASPDPPLSPQSASVSHRATSTPPPPSHRDRKRSAVPATRQDVVQWQHHRGPPSYPYRSPPLRGHRVATRPLPYWGQLNRQQGEPLHLKVNQRLVAHRWLSGHTQPSCQVKHLCQIVSIG